MTTYAIGDIHGNYLGLMDVLKKCNFDNDNDTLISLGDVCDGGILTRKVIDKLLTIQNVINVKGNHDEWSLQWMKTGIELPVWWHQGGRATAQSYDFKFKNVPRSHIEFLDRSLPYFIDSQNRVFVHGGFDPLKPIVIQPIEVLTWDRSLFCDYAPKNIIKGYNHVFVGHTTTQVFKTDQPVTFNNLTALDTGGGWNGKLTIMDVDTYEFWQSDINANMQNDVVRYDESLIYKIKSDSSK
jgi:serine/threonine protein phosphatase 1